MKLHHAKEDVLHHHHQPLFLPIHVIAKLMQLEFVEITQLQRQLHAETMQQQHVKEDAHLHHHNQVHQILTHVTAKL
jgi:hypothetical protein